MGTEMVQELRQFAVERNESVYRTCMGLYHKGARLEEFIEVASIEGVKDGSVIKFEEGTLVYMVWMCAYYFTIHRTIQPERSSYSCVPHQGVTCGQH